jgi:branched-chain amino acid transport system permease protein
MTAKLWAFWLGLAVLVVLPFLVSESHTLQLATAGAYLIAILGLDVLAASGQISLGQGAFVGVGAYTTAILMANHGVQDVKTIPIAAVVAGGIGIVLGVPALRLPGLYLALTTFGIAVAFPTVPAKFDHFTGGSNGIELLGRSTETWHGKGHWWLTNGVWLYTLTWTIAVICLVLAWWLLDSRFGQSLRAIRDSELAATASGLNHPALKVVAFGISTAFAGVSGALLAINLARVSPGTFPVQLSLFLLGGAAVGLLGSIWGAVLGALLIVFLPNLAALLPHVNGKHAGPSTLFLGALVIIVMLAVPLVLRVKRA